MFVSQLCPGSACIAACLQRGSARVRAGGFTAKPREVLEVGSIYCTPCSAGGAEPGKLHPKLWGSWGLLRVCPNLQLEGDSATAETPRAQPCSGAARAWRGDRPSCLEG